MRCTLVIPYWARQTSPMLLKQLLATPPAELRISALVEHELRFGFALTPGTRAEELTLRLLEVIPGIPFGSAEARRAAVLRSGLARIGKPIGPYDVLIAATALEHQLTLVTHNVREFRRVEGLAVEDWTV
jgi:tRNA(fMet)-specific endonuclease VapC